MGQHLKIMAVSNRHQRRFLGDIRSPPHYGAFLIRCLMLRYLQGLCLESIILLGRRFGNGRPKRVFSM